jgi:phosphate/sulfate permease
MLMLLWICAKAAPEKVNKKFKFLQLFSAGIMAFSHGSNDAQKVMGIITLSLITGGLLATSVFKVTDTMPEKQHSKVTGQLERPAHLKSTVGTDTAITLEWDAVEHASGYVLEYKRYSETSWTSVALPETTSKIEDIQPDMYYDFRVRAAGDNEMFRSSDWSTIQAKSLGFRVPVWVIFICATTMGLGTMAGGWKIIRTMGKRVIELKPIHGFAAETTAASTILTCSYLGIPISTTHIISTAIMGVGSTIRFSAVKWGLVGNIVLAWFLTIPVCAALASVLYLLFASGQ